MNLSNSAKKYLAKITGINKLNEKIYEITLSLIEPEIINFISGQFISLNVGNGIYRSYSIASSSLDHDKISVLISAAHNGLGANFIKNLKIGDKVEFIGPSGKFLLPDNLKKNVMFVATGTGLAPILSMLDKLNKGGSDLKIRLLLGVRDGKELFKDDFLDELKTKMKDFDYTVCFSKSIPERFLGNAILGRVTQALVDQTDNETDYFICGHPEMVLNISELLEKQGINNENIHKEKFTWAKSK